MSPKNLLGFLALFAVALVVAMYAATYSPSYENCKSGADQSAAQKESERANNFVVGTSVASCEAAFANANGGAITAIATVLLTVVTGGLVWLAWLGLVTTRTQLRAQLFPKGYGQLWSENNPKPGEYSWRMRPLWQNSGQTAAEEVQVYLVCDVRNSMLPEEFDFERGYATQKPFRGLFPPQTTLEAGMAPQLNETAVSPQDILDSQNGRKWIYLYGKVIYWDIFPGTKMHVTHFCWLLQIVGDPLTFIPNDSDHALKFGFLLHNEGNYTEEV